MNLWNDKRYLAWLPPLAFGLSSGYGEQPRRVLVTAAAVVGAYAFLYHWLRLLVPQSDSPWASIGNAVYFSASTFCTFSAPAMNIDTVPLAKLLVASEAFIGAFTMGLFVFTLTRRYVAR